MNSILALSFFVMCLIGVAVSQTTTCACTCNPARQRQQPVGHLEWTGPMGEQGNHGSRGFPRARGPHTDSESARPGSGLPASESPHSHSSRLQAETNAGSSDDNGLQVSADQAGCCYCRCY